MFEKSSEIYNQLKKSYRLTVNDKSTFVEVFSFSFSKLKVFLAVVFLFLVGFGIAVILFFFTPLKITIPGYPTNRTHQLILKNAIAVDSLELELKKRDQFLDKIKAVISGEIVEDTVTYMEHDFEDVELKRMTSDTIFNELIAPDNSKFSYANTKKELEQISNMNLVTPLIGLATNRYDISTGHFGTDLVGSPKAKIATISDGIVIFAEWSVKTGYVVIIQHQFNLISVYKHNSEILVKPGYRVKAGELIAIIGNEGEYSTGPHLHLEMWQNGTPLNPENYFDFRK